MGKISDEFRLGEMWLEIYQGRVKKTELISLQAGKEITAEDRTATLVGVFQSIIGMFDVGCPTCKEPYDRDNITPCESCRQRSEHETEMLVNLGTQLYKMVKQPHAVVKISHEDDLYIYYLYEKTGKTAQRTRERFFEAFKTYSGPIREDGTGDPRWKPNEN